MIITMSSINIPLNNSLPDIESGIQSNTHVKSYGCWLIGLILIITFPINFCDLYFAYNSISCQYVNNPIEITLSDWLKVSGFTGFGFSLLIVIQLACILNANINYFILTVQIIITYIIIVFSFVWLIIGCVIFWHYTMNSNCDKDISVYMWIRLIIGILSVLLSSKSNNDKKTTNSANST